MDAEFHKLGLKLKFVYSLAGLLLGLVCIIAGSLLGLNGVVGHTSWTASALGLSTNLNDAGPGVIVFVVGLFIVFVTRFRVKYEREQSGQTENGDPVSAAGDGSHSQSAVKAAGTGRSGGGGGGGGLLRERVVYNKVNPRD